MLGLFSTTKNVSHYNHHQRRDLLDSLLKSGKIGKVKYIKKTTGEIVERSIKLWVERHLTSGNRNIVGINWPAMYDDDLYPCSDLNRDAFRSFSIRNLVELKIGRTTYKFR